MVKKFSCPIEQIRFTSWLLNEFHLTDKLMFTRVNSMTIMCGATLIYGKKRKRYLQGSPKACFGPVPL